MKQSVSIIILNYNGKILLEENLPLIFKYLDPKIQCEVIIVDNNSSDKSIDYINSSFPQIKIVALDKNHCFSKGLNKGAEEANNDYLFFLNNDIQVTKGFLAPLIEHFKDPLVFGVSPKVLRPAQGMLNESIITGEFKGGVISAEFSISQKYKIPDISFEVFSLCGAAMIIDRKKFFQIKGMDEIFYPFYYEETDLSYRAQKHGWKIIYEPASLVYHKHNQSIGKYLAKSTALWSYRKNQYLCVWKNISDPWLLIKHIFQMIIPKLLIPNIIEWKALISAFKQSPQALKQRENPKTPSLLTDNEIFKKALLQIKMLKNSML